LVIEYLFERQLKLATVEVIARGTSTNETDINPRGGRSLLGVRLGLLGVVQELGDDGRLLEESTPRPRNNSLLHVVVQSKCGVASLSTKLRVLTSCPAFCCFTFGSLGACDVFPPFLEGYFLLSHYSIQWFMLYEEPD
jgi:hypothetical protein